MKILKVKLEYWLPGITIGASGARKKTSLRDFTLEKLYDRWAIMLVTLIHCFYIADQRKAWYTLYSAEEKV